jgi:hypothetical protein
MSMAAENAKPDGSSIVGKRTMLHALGGQPRQAANLACIPCIPGRNFQPSQPACALHSQSARGSCSAVALALRMCCTVQQLKYQLADCCCQDAAVGVTDCLEVGLVQERKGDGASRGTIGTLQTEAYTSLVTSCKLCFGNR